MSKITSLNEKFESSRGNPHGFPATMHYTITEESGGAIELCIKDAEMDDKVWRCADSWGLAAFDEACKTLSKPPSLLHFNMRNPSEKEKPKYEALKRRLSYLSIKNKFISKTIIVGGREEGLYTADELKNRPVKEILHNDYLPRGDDDKPGRLEKDFQTYLFGKGLYDGNNDEIGRTNERLALLGEDFIHKNKFRIEREFPTGVFNGDIKECNRILPTDFIDLVTINKNKNIAVIEIKFNDKPLEVISQLLNYALFFFMYRKQLTPLLDVKFACDTSKFGLDCYIVSNAFHKRYGDVWKYYAGGKISMKQITIGYINT